MDPTEGVLSACLDEKQARAGLLCLDHSPARDPRVGVVSSHWMGAAAKLVAISNLQSFPVHL
eukprot:2067121-Ditylum_brightwellii.AAC.1